jgi:hypothetical protein
MTTATTSNGTSAEATTKPTTASAPLFPYIAECAALLARAAATIPADESMTTRDKRHVAKARKGGERYVPKLVSLAKEHGVELRAAPLDEISADMNEATKLASLLVQIEQLTKRVNDRLFAVRGRSWSRSSKLYVVMKRLAKDDGELEAGLASIVEFFKQRRASVPGPDKKAKAGKASKGTVASANGAGNA